MTEGRTSKFFDIYAYGFDAIYGNKNTFWNNLINKMFRKSMRIRFKKTIDGCYPIKGKSVIDIGCGPGHFGISLALRGAGQILGVDFAEGMIKIARENASSAGVDGKCRFMLCDFMETDISSVYDYSIVMGVMDYIEQPGNFISKVLSVTKSKAFFSFPVDEGILAWQRKLRYRSRCDLFMYSLNQLEDIFNSLGCKSFSIEKISRDYFVEVNVGK
jgi:2-polyprenyl-3-methyl-5-hydroxy-6-metoxy-1,4-benzoquinol methylase